MTDGLSLLISRARATISAAGMPVSFSAHSGGVGLHEILQLVQAEHPLLDVPGVVEPLLEDHVHEGVVQRQVGAGPDHPVAVGLGGGDGDARVDVGQLGAGCHGVHEAIDLFDRDGLEKVAAVHDDVLAVLVVDPHLGVGVPEKRAAGRVDRALAQGVVGEVVGRADGFQKASCSRGWTGWSARSGPRYVPPCFWMTALSLAAM